MHTMPAWKHAQAAKPLNFVAAASDEQESVVVECNIRLAVLYKLYAFATSSQVFPQVFPKQTSIVSIESSPRLSI